MDTVDMQGAVCLVTGASSGIGRATARALAQQGATVVTVSRGSGRGAEVAETVARETGGSVTFLAADLASLADTRRVAQQFKDRFARLDVLVNNAGMIVKARRQTDEGLEQTLALNHLSYFLLTHVLLERLLASRPARIINVSSGAERFGRIDFDDPLLTKNYNSWRAYGQSKLANVMFTYELARRLSGTGVTVNALNPGGVATGFGRGNGGVTAFVFRLLRPFLASPEQGAETSLYLANSAEIEGVTGKYFHKRKPVPSSDRSYDSEAAARLWTLSERLVGLTEEEARPLRQGVQR